MTRKLPPAIPEAPEVPQKWFYLGEMRDPFESIKHNLLRPSRGHYFKAPIPEQMTLWGMDNE